MGWNAVRTWMDVVWVVHIAERSASLQCCQKGGETMNEMMTLSEVAAFMRISMPTLNKLCSRSDFPVISIGRRKMVLRSALMEWLVKEGGKRG